MHILVVFFLILAPGLLAQDAPKVRRNNVEVGVFPGFSYGLDYGVKNIRPMVGGNVAWAPTRFLLPYGDFSFFPEFPRRSEISGTLVEQQVNVRARIYDIHGGVHLRFVRPEKRYVPYAAFGLGLLRSNLDIESSSRRRGDAQFSAPVTDHRNTSDFAFNGGGGLRVYATSRWGFRAEGKFYRPTTGEYQGVFSKFTFGLFYQLH